MCAIRRKVLGSKTLSVPLPASLFHRFFSFFPYSLNGTVFNFSVWRFSLYTVVLSLFAINTGIRISYVEVPFDEAYNKLTFFFPSIAHVVSLSLCLVSVVWQRKIVNVPFVHFELAVSILRSVGLNPNVRCPLYFYIGPYAVPVFVVLPDMLLLDLNAFKVLTFLNDYLMVYLFYQSLFEILGFFKMMENALLYCKNSLDLLGDGIHYLGKTDKIESLIYSFHHLSSSCVLFNEVFSMNILTTVSIAFVGGTASVYTIIVVFLIRLSSHSLLMIVSANCLNLIIYCFLTWQLVNTCTSCVQEINEFNGLMYQLMIEDETNEILHSEKMRLHILMNREVVFTACNFFTIDYALVHSMIAAATTYLVILVQFSPEIGSTDGPTALPSPDTNTTLY